MNMFKKSSLILPAVISTSFLVSCTHVFESKNAEIDLSVFKNIKSNMEALSTSVASATTPVNNHELVMKLAVESVSRDINNQNRTRKKSSKQNVSSLVKTVTPKIAPSKVVLAQSITNDIVVIPSREIGLIEHHGFNGEIKNQIDFKNLNWTLPVDSKKSEDAKNEEMVIDTIQTASAATEKDGGEDDDIKVFDYNSDAPEIANNKTVLQAPDESSLYQLPEDLKFQESQVNLEIAEDKIVKAPKYAEAKISSSVLNVIKRESNSGIKVKNKDRFLLPNLNNEIVPKTEIESDEPSVYDIADSISKEASSTLKKPVKDIIKNAFADVPVEGAEKISYKILAREVDPGVKTTEAFGFEFIPHYDRNDRVSDSSGEINLEYSVMGSQNVVSGMLLKQGFVDIQTDLDLDSSTLKTTIPLIEVEKFEKFLQKNKLSMSGSYVLLNTTKGYTDIEVEDSRAQKILLNSKFNPIKNQEEPTFILVSGIIPGNNFVKIKNETGWTQKVLNTQESMITYIDEEFKESVEQSLELYTETKSGKLVELNTGAIDIKLLSSNNTIKKISTNKVSYKAPSTLNTQKNYLEIKKESTTFIGVSGEESEINLPSQREKEMILTEFGVSDLQNMCLIQINGSEDIQQLRVGGPSDVGEVYTQVLYADREGNLSQEISEWTNKAYILGDRVGVLNIQAEYSNGAVKMTNSYCSNDIYIVENL